MANWKYVRAMVMNDVTITSIRKAINKIPYRVYLRQQNMWG